MVASRPAMVICDAGGAAVVEGFVVGALVVVVTDVVGAPVVVFTDCEG
jgi:hypothetical protein